MEEIYLDELLGNYIIKNPLRMLARITSQSDKIRGQYPIIVYNFSGDGVEVEVLDLVDNVTKLQEAKYEAARKFARSLAKKVGGEFVDKTLDKIVAD